MVNYFEKNIQVSKSDSLLIIFENLTYLILSNIEHPHQSKNIAFECNVNTKLFNELNQIDFLFDQINLSQKSENNNNSL